MLCYFVPDENFRCISFCQKKSRYKFSAKDQLRPARPYIQHTLPRLRMATRYHSWLMVGSWELGAATNTFTFLYQTIKR